MRTLIIIVSGLVLLGLFTLAGRFIGGGMAKAALWFIPVWLLATAYNMWVGVSQAGYSVGEEAPILLLNFGVSAAVALFLWHKLST